ncbi:MAG: hypothetical protein LUG66_00930 [Clostridiales bacterium]|nr:hypothetical protein [Clostridiales bacterium]
MAEFLGRGKKNSGFDTAFSNKYVEWLSLCCDDVFADESIFRDIGKIILDEAVKQGMVCVLPSSPDYKIYGLNKKRVYITDQVIQLRCDKCGSVFAAAAENEQLWTGAPCMGVNCDGELEKFEGSGVNYYGRLYSSGDLARINAREHTGLLERSDRETLENDFKREKNRKNCGIQMCFPVRLHWKWESI